MAFLPGSFVTTYRPIIMSPVSDSRRPARECTISVTRSRTRFSPEQLQVLEEKFQENQYPDCDFREQLAFKLGVNERSIKHWFQNKRARRQRKSASEQPKQREHINKQAKRDLWKKRPENLFIPSTDVPKGECNVIWNSNETRMRSPSSWILPTSPIFSPGSSPGFSRMFQFPSPREILYQSCPSQPYGGTIFPTMCMTTAGYLNSIYSSDSYNPCSVNDLRDFDR